MYELASIKLNESGTKMVGLMFASDGLSTIPGDCAADLRADLATLSHNDRSVLSVL